MRICLISFDFWNYDFHIVDELKSKGIDAHHINLRDYKHVYPTPFHRIGNFFGKLFLKRNVKKIAREKYILKELSALGTQDQILVINPELITISTHQEIRRFTDHYIAYLYDSIKRNPVDHLLNKNLFHTTYSFDPKDVKNFNLKPLTNYIYFNRRSVPAKDILYDCFTVISIDERLESLNKISECFKKEQLVSKFVLVGKSRPTKAHPNIEFSEDRMNQEEMHEKIAQSKAVLDLLRENQTGISFRVFEAIGLQKKIITSNQHVRNLDFYDPNNILIIDPNNPAIPRSFLESPYIPIPNAVYRKYTLEGWVEKVFDL